MIQGGTLKSFYPLNKPDTKEQLSYGLTYKNYLDSQIHRDKTSYREPGKRQ